MSGKVLFSREGAPAEVAGQRCLSASGSPRAPLLTRVVVVSHNAGGLRGLLKAGEGRSGFVVWLCPGAVQHLLPF